jgi:hypothetical protein
MESVPIWSGTGFVPWNQYRSGVVLILYHGISSTLEGGDSEPRGGTEEREMGERTGESRKTGSDRSGERSGERREGRERRKSTEPRDRDSERKRD